MFPLGSILGPLLFLLYINDLPLASNDSHFILFADDTNIIFSHDNPDRLENIINNELRIISNWFKLNKLSLNINKTNYMIFRNKYSNKTNFNPTVRIDDKNIVQVDVTKFLGILIDCNLSWKSHTTHITKIVSRYNGIIRKIKPYLNKTSLLTLYNTLVLPYLSYCTMIWGDRNNSHLNTLFLMQKKIIRTCTNSIWLEHTNPLFFSTRNLKIHDIYIYQLAIHMFRHHYKLIPNDLPNNEFIIQASIHHYNTRQALDLHIDPTKSVLASNTIKTQGPKLWNSINPKFKTCRSLSSFKKNIKTHITTQYDSVTSNIEYASIK